MATIESAERLMRFEGDAVPLYIARPRADERRVAVLVLGAIWGVTPHIHDVCHRLAGVGFSAVAPDLYRGLGAPTLGAPPEVLAEAFEAFPDERGIRDCREVVRRMAKGALDLRADAVAVWGFCMGGRFAHYVAAVSEHVGAAINMYGRLTFPRQEHKPVMPLELTGLITSRYLGVFAERDEVVPDADVAALRCRLANRALHHDVLVYPGTRHGFFDDTRPEHHPTATADSWRRVLDLLDACKPI